MAIRSFGLWWPLIAALFFPVSAWAVQAWTVSGGEGFYPKRPPQMVLAADGTPVVAYYDHRGNIQVRRKDGKPQPLNGSRYRGRLSGLALAAIGDTIWVAWRERHEHGHALVLRRSLDGGRRWGKKVIIDSASEPLPRIQIGGDARCVYMLWLGQRLDADPEPMPPDPEEGDPRVQPPKHSYHIYASHSRDQGKTWSAPVKLTEGYADSIWPALAIQGDIAYTFSASIKNGKRYLMVRSRRTGGRWSPPSHLKEVGDVLLLRAVPLRGGVMALWLAAYPDHYLLEGAISRDQGRNWHTFAIDETKILDIANLEIAVQGEQLNVVFSARPRGGRGQRKQTIYLLHSANGGRNWEPLRILRHVPYQGTRALYPRIVADTRKVVAVWNDYRNFRGDLYFNVSTDGGATWLQEDVPLEPRGRYNTFLYPFAKSLALRRDRCHLLAGRYSDDRFSPAGVELILLQFEPKPKYPKRSLLDDMGSEKKVSMLRERAKAFWEALKEGDYAAAYELFDPFFRGRFRKVDYLAATGLVHYQSFDIEKVAVDGNLGYVTLRYRYEIPAITTRLGTVSRPPTEAKVRETWLFIDGNWYKEYQNKSSGGVFGRY